MQYPGDAISWFMSVILDDGFFWLGIVLLAIAVYIHFNKNLPYSQSHDRKG